MPCPCTFLLSCWQDRSHSWQDRRLARSGFRGSPFRAPSKIHLAFSNLVDLGSRGSRGGSLIKFHQREAPQFLTLTPRNRENSNSQPPMRCWLPLDGAEAATCKAPTAPAPHAKGMRSERLVSQSWTINLVDFALISP